MKRLAEAVLIVGYGLVDIGALVLLGLLGLGRLPFLPFEWLWAWAQRRARNENRGGESGEA